MISDTTHYRLFVFLILLSFSTAVTAFESALDLKEIYSKTVDKQLALPADERHYYAELLLYHLQHAGKKDFPAQYILMIDRNANVQAGLLFWLKDNNHVELIGASPVSTGKVNGYNYFETPLGIFDHSVEHLDFRAEGTTNKFGLMGYGDKGMRVYDFGWVTARKTWKSEVGEMRLQMHSTDLTRLEPKLGKAQSRGCIRIPASMNTLIDHYGLLDADYEIHIARSSVFKILDPNREATPWSGRYVIVVDSRRVSRPAWSPLPR